MKKLNLAIIGQGRSGKNIHGIHYRSERNEYFNVKYVVELDEYRRNLAKELYPGCEVMEDYKDLFDKEVDLVVNDTYSDTHYSITKDLLLHGKNVLVEKPFARSKYECDELIKIAEEKGLVLAVFQQTFYAPFYRLTLDKIKEGVLGEIKQINIRYNGFSRRWDWQTLQKRCAGGLYNTGPHPVGMALGYLGFDKNVKIEFSRLDTVLTSGDGDDYAKIILTAPDKPVVDVEVSSNDAYSDYNVKILGSRGTLKCKAGGEYEMVYIKDGENPERKPLETFLENEEKEPVYCSEKLIKHEISGKVEGTAFDIGTSELYRDLYYRITEGKDMYVNAKMAAEIIRIIEAVHADNPLPLKF